MIVMFLGVIVCVMLVLFVINANYLGSFYVSNKEIKFIRMYERLNQAMAEGTAYSPDLSAELRRMAERNNMSFLVINDTGEEDMGVITNVYDMDVLRKQLMGRRRIIKCWKVQIRIRLVRQKIHGRRPTISRCGESLTMAAIS